MDFCSFHFNRASRASRKNIIHAVISSQPGRNDRVTKVPNIIAIQYQETKKEALRNIAMYSAEPKITIRAKVTTK